MDDPRTPDRPRVLVAYATAAGSTAGVAEHIAEALRDDGATVTCRPVGADLDPTPFDALVVGSAVHNMAWLPPALGFLAHIPSERPLWCFSVAGVNARNRLTRTMAELEAGRIAEQFPAGLAPRDHRIFAGVVDMRGTPLWGRAFYWLTGSRPGDNRDWPVIEAWAHGISGALAAPAPSHPGTRP